MKLSKKEWEWLFDTLKWEERNLRFCAINGDNEVRDDADDELDICSSVLSKLKEEFEHGTTDV